MPRLLKLSPAIAASLLIAACGSSSPTKTATHASTPASTASSTSSAPMVKTASNPTLGTILVTGQGMTLYHLSGESAGKFICTTSACMGVWHPLTVPAGTTPTGLASLGTVKRPEGTMQVTYKGSPLYTFAQDTKAGETNGQGIKDVGTWSAATTSGSTSKPSTSAPPASAPSSSGGGESSGYGY
jgi:predicted lipoprotein with Yx(FWY)xxD motif